MLFSMKRLRQLLGVLWLIDGLLQLQPQMFTMNMVNGVMAPIVDGQPGFISSNLQWIVNVVTNHIVLVNLIIAIAQIVLGVLLITGIWVRGTIIASIVWSLIVWYAGEGMSMLFTGQGSLLTGAPGAVLLYPILGLAVYPRGGGEAKGESLITRLQLRWVLAGFWIFVGLLQLQPYWWQPEQISQAIGGMVGGGGLNTYLVDPLLQPIANATANAEIPLNIILIVLCLGLGVALAVVKQEQIRPFLIVSIVLSVLVWYFTQALGMIFTGMATDFNSGLLLVVIALGCWPLSLSAETASKKTGFSREIRQQIKEGEAGSTQTV